jgi:hypothetical protein
MRMRIPGRSAARVVDRPRSGLYQGSCAFSIASLQRRAGRTACRQRCDDSHLNFRFVYEWALTL